MKELENGLLLMSKDELKSKTDKSFEQGVALAESYYRSAMSIVCPDKLEKIKSVMTTKKK